MSASYFTPASTFLPEEMRQSVSNTAAVADLDGDGRMDLIMRSKYGSYAGASDGPVQGIQAWRNTEDGWVRFDSNPLQVDTGGGQLAPLTTDGAVALADIDNDGKLELVTLDKDLADGTNFRVYRLEGGALHALTGADNPLANVALPAADAVLPDMGPFTLIPGPLALADYDKDGRVDIVLGSRVDQTGLWAFHNTVAGFELDTTTFANVDLGDRTFVAPAFTDLDGDSHLDLVLGSSAPSPSGKYGTSQVHAYLYNTVTDTFDAPGTDPVAGLAVKNYSAPVFLDIDGDSRNDMVTSDKYGHLSAFHGEQDGSFTPLDDPGSITGVHGAPSFIDLDGDGLLDMIPGAGSNVLTGNTDLALRNTGTGFEPFAVDPLLDTPNNLSRAIAVDLDGDGDKDLLFGGFAFYGVNGGDAPVPDSFENKGDGTYQRMVTDPFAAIAGDHKWGVINAIDMNADGREDLVVLDTADATFRVLLATPDGFVEDTTNPLNGFQTGEDTNDGVNEAGFALVDLDGDGDRDLVTSAIDGSLYTYENLGDGFAPFAENPIGGGGPIGALPFTNGPVFTDVDGDGRLDFVGMDAPLSQMAKYAPESITNGATPAVWRNTGDGWEKLDQADNPYRTVKIYPFDLPILSFADLDGDNHLEAMRSEKYGQTQLVGVVGLSLVGGTPYSDSIEGTADNDIIRSLDRNDTIHGNDGDDVLDGGAGGDLLDGGGGRDTADYNVNAVGVRASLISGHAYNGDADGDQFQSIENLAGSGYNDSFCGDDGANQADGRDGEDVLVGAGGDDSLNGGDGADDLRGGNGDDVLAGGAGGDRLGGGNGSDTADYTSSASGVAASLATRQGSGGDAEGDVYVSIENLTGSASGDTLTGSFLANHLEGRAGDDTIDGGSGDDVILGGTGQDSLHGGVGNDSLNGDDAADRMFGDGGDDTMTGGLGDDLVIGSLGADQIYGETGADTLRGGANDDNLRGGDGDDLIIGGTGNDILLGGLGADTLVGRGGFDMFRYYSAADGGDQINGYLRDEDVIEVSASGFGGGLVEAETAAFIIADDGLATSDVGVGQFVWDRDDRTLYWDVDGTGTEDAVVVAVFAGGGAGFDANEIRVIG